MIAALAPRVRCLREKRELTPSALAQAAMVPEAWLVELENGRVAEPDVRALQRLAAALGTDLYGLIHGPEPAAPVRAPKRPRAAVYEILPGPGWRARLIAAARIELALAQGAGDGFAIEMWGAALRTLSALYRRAA